MYTASTQTKDTNPEAAIMALIHSNIPLLVTYDPMTGQPNLDVRLESSQDTPLFSVKSKEGEKLYLDLTATQQPLISQRDWTKEPRYIVQKYIIEANSDITILLQKNPNYKRLRGMERLCVRIQTSCLGN